MTTEGLTVEQVAGVKRSSIRDARAVAARLPSHCCVAIDGRDDLAGINVHVGKCQVVIDFDGGDRYGYATFDGAKFVPGLTHDPLVNDVLPSDMIAYINGSMVPGEDAALLKHADKERISMLESMLKVQTERTAKAENETAAQRSRANMMADIVDQMHKAMAYNLAPSIDTDAWARERAVKGPKWGAEHKGPWR